MVRKKTKSVNKENEKVFKNRPPVVVILGHVDHGKTTLLSSIRETDLTTKEYGGITQHIGAYQIEHQGKKITFIDTPGHEAFAKMRSYGAKVADLAILVVAADDGVKPQTKEAIQHIKAAGIPFLVAINKTDLPGASPDMVKAQLAQENVLVEGYGGNIVTVNISGKQKKGLDELLEMILLLAEMEDLKGSNKGELRAIIIESKLDSKRGIVTSLIIKDGTLKLKDEITVVNKNQKVFTNGKIKRIIDDKGRSINKAEPGRPVEIMGIKKVVSAGLLVKLLEGKELKKTKVVKKITRKIVKKEDEDKEEKKKIKIILKADTFGVLQAIKASFSEEVEIIHSQTGEVSESDVLLAKSTGSVIIAFNVNMSSPVQKLADMEKVIIKKYRIIYELLEDIQSQVLKILEPTIDEEILGEGKVIAEFKIKGNHIAGCRVTKGVINKRNLIHIKRGDKIITNSKVKSFQKEKQEVQEVKVGDEVGIVFQKDVDFEKGDVILSYSKK